MEIRKTGSSSGVSIYVPSSFTSYSLTLPTTDGNTNEVLTTNGAGTLSWSIPTRLGDTSTFILVTPGSALIQLYVAGSEILQAYTNTLLLRKETRVQSGVKFMKPVSADGVTVIASASLVSSYTLTLPTTAGNANEVLTTNGAGTLSWTVPNSGTGTTGAFVKFTDGAAGTLGNSVISESNGHLISSGTTPTIASSQGSTVIGNDIAGVISVGATEASFTLTYAGSYSSAPVCILTRQAIGSCAAEPFVSILSAGTVAIVVNISPTCDTTFKINYICMGK